MQKVYHKFSLLNIPILSVIMPKTRYTIELKTALRRKRTIVEWYF